MKLNMISKGANGKIFGVKSWHKSEFFAMKQIDFEYLDIATIYKILTNWNMVNTLNLMQKPVEIYCDSQKSLFLIVTRLYDGSMCDLLMNTYSNTQQYLSENELKKILKNGVLSTLYTLHTNGYIHGDIKPDNW